MTIQIHLKSSREIHVAFLRNDFCLIDLGRYCGYTFPAAGSLTSSVYPFEMSVHTDSNEENGEAGYQGFAMTWTQVAC